MTRSEWYARNYAGCWRTARKAFLCDHSDCTGWRCRHVVQAGEKYFDTMQRKAESMATKRICEQHANEQL